MSAVLGDARIRLLPAALRAADERAFFLTVRIPKQHPSAEISRFVSLPPHAARHNARPRNQRPHAGIGERGDNFVERLHAR